jgi:hypothetical protein
MATMLDEALVNLWANVVGGGTLWTGEVPSTASSYPRQVLRLGAELPLDPQEWNVDTGTPVETVAEFEFEVITSNDPDGCRTLIKAVMAVYTPRSLAAQLATDSNVVLLRTGYQSPTIISQRGPNDLPLYSAKVSYKAMFGTNY